MKYYLFFSLFICFSCDKKNDKGMLKNRALLIQYSFNEQFLAISRKDRVEVWDIEDRKMEKKFNTGIKSGDKKVKFKGNLLFELSEKLRVWDITTNLLLKEMRSDGFDLCDKYLVNSIGGNLRLFNIFEFLSEKIGDKKFPLLDKDRFISDTLSIFQNFKNKITQYYNHQLAEVNVCSGCDEKECSSCDEKVRINNSITSTGQSINQCTQNITNFRNGKNEMQDRKNRTLIKIEEEKNKARVEQNLNRTAKTVKLIETSNKFQKQINDYRNSINNYTNLLNTAKIEKNNLLSKKEKIYDNLAFTKQKIKNKVKTIDKLKSLFNKINLSSFNNFQKNKELIELIIKIDRVIPLDDKILNKDNFLSLYKKWKDIKSLKESLPKETALLIQYSFNEFIKI